MFIVEDQLMGWTLTNWDDHYSMLKLCLQTCICGDKVMVEMI